MPGQQDGDRTEQKQINELENSGPASFREATECLAWTSWQQAELVV